MDVPSASLTVANPLTGASYRLVIGETSWRITKSIVHDGRLILRHARGVPGDTTINQVVIDGLLRNDLHVPGLIGNPVDHFAAIVITDFDRTYDLLAALVKDAHRRMRDGTHGFRAGSPALKQEAKRTLLRAGDMCQSMATSWKESGLTTASMPIWMSEALSDE